MLHLKAHKVTTAL